MAEKVERGYVSTDAFEFGEKEQIRLQTAQQEICYLLDRGYEIGKAVTFVGNHYMLSARQRTALIRASASKKDLEIREKKRWKEDCRGKSVYLDGFNTIITLEAALSNTILLSCMDSTIRDLCGLHGTYRMIDKTEQAIQMIGKKLQSLGTKEAIFYLDSPISNSGRLKAKILEKTAEFGFITVVEMVQNADAMLWDKELVVSSDAIILDRCLSWVNLVRAIIEEYLQERSLIELSKVR